MQETQNSKEHWTSSRGRTWASQETDGSRQTERAAMTVISGHTHSIWIQSSINQDEEGSSWLFLALCPLNFNRKASSCTLAHLLYQIQLGHTVHRPCSSPPEVVKPLSLCSTTAPPVHCHRRASLTWCLAHTMYASGTWGITDRKESCQTEQVQNIHSQKNTK